MNLLSLPMLLFLFTLPPVAAGGAPGAAEAVAFRVQAQLPDVLEPPAPGAVRLEGYLGGRVAANARNRLLLVDEEPILAGFRQRPGRQAWIGEHVGKWLHAATLAWAYNGDPALRAKLDRIVAELLKTQEADGYLGTYTPDKRFGLFPGADWDVWVHKYDLIGLLTYYQYTGNPAALEGARKIGDLLLATFGPGKKSLLAAGTHVGMAATSSLEPVVLLYRFTGDPRYLDFARGIVRAWDEPGGPKILATLTTEKSVLRTANAKAYEMLSNLVGLCELARATGDRSYLAPAVNAWEDIVANHLYLTGTASQGEHFHEPHQLPNQPGANIGETCVTVTWVQLNAQLLRLTGAARYANELERAAYNHLAAAQRPDGAQWCYFTALEGTKPYGPGINCCVSSGPRAMALLPQLAYLRGRAGGQDELVVNLCETSRATLNLGGKKVTVEQTSAVPHAGGAALTLRLDRPATFGLRARVPPWAEGLTLSAGGQKATIADGWAILPARSWKDGDQATIAFTIAGRRVSGEHSNAGRAALVWGPLVLAEEESRNPGLPPAAALGLTDAQPPVTLQPPVEQAGGNPPGTAPLVFTAPVRAARDGAARTATFVPFADAGAGGGRYRVWLRAPGAGLPENASLFAFAAEARSRQGNVNGEIGDGDASTYVVTFNGRPAAEDWFALALDRPVQVRRVVFAHGSAYHDGGWFDAGAGKPRIQARREKDGPWETIGTLDDYPATTATDAAGLKPGQLFTLRLAAPVAAIAIRVIGKPATGDNPAQAFSSCAELQAFGE